MGIETFASTQFKEIIEMLEIKTGMKIDNFLKINVIDLIMDVLNDMTSQMKWIKE